MTMSEKTVVARFYRLASGRELVREWLTELPREDRGLIGRDIMGVEFGWPYGPPLCASLTNYPGPYEVYSNLTGKRIARAFSPFRGGIWCFSTASSRKPWRYPGKNSCSPSVE